MVSLETVKKSNSALNAYGRGLVGVFVGGTSGIGESTARAFVRYTLAPRVYLIGRNETQAFRIIDELRQVNPDGEISFVKCDVSLLNGVDRACRTIQEKEEKVNVLFLSPGVMTTKGRDETEEGLDKKLNLHYYSRMRFVANLLPQLTNAATADNNHLFPSVQGGTRNLSSVVTVLSPGNHQGPLLLNDLALKQNYTLGNCATHAITMTNLAIGELAKAHPSTAFVHTDPGAVRTGLLRDFGPVVQAAMSVAWVFLRPWSTPLEESGERHLYAATSTRFPARAEKRVDDKGDEVAPGLDGVKGSGAYLVQPDGSPTRKMKLLSEYREKGIGEVVWAHTLKIFSQTCEKV